MGHMLQIFSLINGIDALTELALGYVAMAAQCKTHGDNHGFERNLDRAQDAYAALRLITDLRADKPQPKMAGVFRAIKACEEMNNPDEDFLYTARTIIEEPGNAIADNAAALLAVLCLPAPRKSIVAEVVRPGPGLPAPLVNDFFDTFSEAHEWGRGVLRFYDGAVLRIRAAVATDFPVYPAL